MGGVPSKVARWSVSKVGGATNAVLGAVNPGKSNVPPPPPPADEVAAMIQEFSRSATDRRLRQSKGRGSFLSLDPGGEPYRAPGSKSTTGA